MLVWDSSSRSGIESFWDFIISPEKYMYTRNQNVIRQKINSLDCTTTTQKQSGLYKRPYLHVYVLLETHKMGCFKMMSLQIRLISKLFFSLVISQKAWKAMIYLYPCLVTFSLPLLSWLHKLRNIGNYMVVNFDILDVKITNNAQYQDVMSDKGMLQSVKTHNCKFRQAHQLYNYRFKVLIVNGLDLFLGWRGWWVHDSTECCWQACYSLPFSSKNSPKGSVTCNCKYWNYKLKSCK